MGTTRFTKSTIPLRCNRNQPVARPVRRNEAASTVSPMQACAHLGPRYRLDSAGSILGDAVLDLSGPCFLNSPTRPSLTALQQTTPPLPPLSSSRIAENVKP